MQARWPLETDSSRKTLVGFVFAIFVISISNESLAGIMSEKSKIRLGGSMGYGYTESVVSDQKGSEQPGAFDVFTEYVIDSHKVFGIQHLRSLSLDEGQISTAISFTGMYAKWFPGLPISQDIPDTRYINTDYIIQKNIAPYFETGFGVAQSSLRDKIGGALAKGSVGFYLSAKMGVEVPLYKWMGMLWDIGYQRTLIGDGTISMQSSCLGLYFYF